MQTSPHLRRYPFLASAAAIATATTALALFSGPDGASAASGQSASARLVRLNISTVAALGTTAFSGVYGKADSPVIGPDDPGDFSDPDGVLTYVTLDGNKVTRTSNNAAKVYAQAQSSGMSLHLHNTNDFIQISPRSGGSVSTLDTYAECIPEPVGLYALAYARTAGAQIEVLGHQIPVGVTRFAATGAELGQPNTLGDSELTVVYTPHQEPPGGAATHGVGTAHAWVDIAVTGVLRDKAGAEVYSGPIVGVRLGDVTAVCDAVVPTTPPPTTPTHTVEPNTTPPTESPTTVPPTTDPPTTDPPTTAPTTTAPPTTAPPTTAPPSTTAPPTASPSPQPSGSGSPGGGDGLAQTGASVEPFAAAGLGLAALGAAVVTGVRLSRRRPGRH